MFCIIDICLPSFSLYMPYANDTKFCLCILPANFTEQILYHFQVIVDVEDSFVSFPLPTYNASISENIDITNGPVLLIDLNSTEETMNFNVIYSLSRTSWAGNNTNLNYQTLQCGIYNNSNNGQSEYNQIL